MGLQPKEIAESTGSWIKQNKAFTAIIAAFVVSQAYILTQIWTHPLIWDTSIYWGMGKALFSGNQIGLWEQFRPPMLPIILGTLWKLGMPAEGFTRLLAVLFSTAGLTGIYFMAKDLYTKKAAAYTVGIIAATSTFAYYTNMLLTGIPASFLVFTSVYLATKKKHLSAGIIGGLAFLTRFPAALVGPAAVLYIAYTHRTELKQLVLEASKYTAGFFAVAIPYMAANHHFYGSALQPFIRGFSIPASTQSTYLYGVFYMFNGIKASLFLALLPVGLYMILKYREKKYYGFAAALTLLYGFFTYFPRKEVRFILLFLPLMALVSARGLKEVVERIQHERITSERKNMVVAAVFVVMILFAGFQVYQQKQWVNQNQVDFYRAHSNLTGSVAANDAQIMPYGDFKYLAMPPLTLDAHYEQAQEEADYFSINTCAWYCFPGDDKCKQRIENYEENVSENYANVYQDHGEQCQYDIYRVN